MISYIYSSSLKSEMYLYTTIRDDFSTVPEPLLKAFGKPDFSMVVNLDKRDKLARVDISLVTQKLKEDGYYLQMPPTILADQNYLEPDEK
ncbi:MAG: YcgL domain-containing protein [Gammaproteobacteria bacterium]|nr:YcgL domain-containing protein [Gammaproteobacteria bacterium]